MAVTYGLSVRYLIPSGLLEQLSETFEPIVALGWDDPELEQAIARTGVATCRLPPARIGDDLRRERRRLREVHERALASPTSRVQRWERRTTGTDRVLAELRRARDRAVTALPGSAGRVVRRVEELVRTDTDVAAYDELLDRRRVDAVLSFTPYHDEDALLLAAAGARGTPAAVSLISWDNPTTRARWLARPSFVTVWNHRNATELTRVYPELAGSITVAGAPQFDIHHRAGLVVDEAEWRATLRLPLDRRILLYNAGPESLVPGEPALVAMIDNAVEDGRLPADLHILVRRHPADSSHRWSAVGPRLRHTTLTAAWNERPVAFRSWPTEADLTAQMSSYAHSSVHLSVCSSTSLDGAMFGRPQICPAFVPGASRRDARRIAELYDQEHWAPIATTGAAPRVDDAPSLWTEITRALEHPDADEAARRTMLAEVLTAADGAASERVAASLTGWASQAIR